MCIHAYVRRYGCVDAHVARTWSKLKSVSKQTRKQSTANIQQMTMTAGRQASLAVAAKYVDTSGGAWPERKVDTRRRKLN